MVKLLPQEQHLDRQPLTVVTLATTWWETVLACVKLQGIGLGVHLPVKVCFISTQGHLRTGFMAFEAILWQYLNQLYD